MPQTQPSRIAVVDDDEAVRHAMGFLLASLGRDNDIFDSGEAFLAAEPARYAALITDYQMPHTTGLQLARRLRDRSIVMPTLLVSGALNDEVISAARALGVQHFASKPASTAQIAEFLASAP